MNKYILIDSENYDENQDYFDLIEENKQLKSILTELEEWLKEEKMHIYFSDEHKKLIELKNILDKIQKLKEKHK